MTNESRVRARLAQHWGLADATVIAHHGGMGSATWFVAQGRLRWVAKAVAPALRAPFGGGLQVAAAVDAAGIPAGPPVPTRDGRLLVSLDGQALALLTWVPGTSLTGEGRAEQQVIGETLGRVHQSCRASVLLYDLASAVIYLGGPEHGEHLVQAYLRQGELPAAEVARALPVLLRFRWAVQADYFAQRITGHDLTGVGGPADNEKGLEDARRWLERLGD